MGASGGSRPPVKKNIEAKDYKPAGLMCFAKLKILEQFFKYLDPKEEKLGELSSIFYYLIRNNQDLDDKVNEFNHFLKNNIKFKVDDIFSLFQCILIQLDSELKSLNQQDNNNELNQNGQQCSIIQNLFLGKKKQNQFALYVIKVLLIMKDFIEYILIYRQRKGKIYWKIQ